MLFLQFTFCDDAVFLFHMRNLIKTSWRQLWYHITAFSLFVFQKKTQTICLGVENNIFAIFFSKPAGLKMRKQHFEKNAETASLLL